MLTTVVLCTDNLHKSQKYCHSNLTNPYKVGKWVFICESRFEVLPPLSCAL